jgi:hypothetical protein
LHTVRGSRQHSRRGPLRREVILWGRWLQGWRPRNDGDAHASSDRRLSTVIHIKYNVIDYNVRLVLSWPPRLRARGTIPWHPPPCPDTRATASPAPPRRTTADTAAFRRSRAQALASSWPLAHLCTRAHTCELCSVPLGPITLSCRARSTAQRHRDTQRALCTSTSTHTGHLATLHYWLTL